MNFSHQQHAKKEHVLAKNFHIGERVTIFMPLINKYEEGTIAKKYTNSCLLNFDSDQPVQDLEFFHHINYRAVVAYKDIL
ncbi:hypothetical protein [Vagococcus acidifermentans]|uniref:DUF2187 domain-containing protein n=1 Tax=Vagococcus acidifermentans TaxID=564710 RepID=A0A430AM37_9ENTE|nr:hypothetical protein [Vagococcus acidifermentans]RSU09159.1 hypothetical protein CBF27_13290 [Vagococcus acidifermentans]